MRRIINILIFLPLIAAGQKIRINEFDKFIKQRRIESFPLTLASAAQVKMAVSFSSVGPSLYMQLTGTGLGANRIEAEDKVILLLDNDSTITIKSKGYQGFDIGANYYSYKHHYIISYSDLVRLAKSRLQALRKYRAEEFDDVHITKEVSSQFKKLCSLFVDELNKSTSSNIVQTINHKDITKYIGDSVIVEGIISGGRYFSNSEEEVTLLNVGEVYPNESFSIVIRGIDRKIFGDKPESLYRGKLVRITGRVELYNKKPQIKVTSKQQLLVLADNHIANSNTAVNTISPESGNSKEQTLAIAPAFPGGAEVWADFLKRNLNPSYNLSTRESKIVIVRFLVKSDGSVDNLEIVQSGGPVFDKEVLRVIKRMPKWKAAIENGRTVDAIVTQTVTFHSRDKQIEL
jgi:TonB family protein